MNEYSIPQSPDFNRRDQLNYPLNHHYNLLIPRKEKTNYSSLYNYRAKYGGNSVERKY